MIKMHIDLHVKCPLFLSDFHGTWNFSADFTKKKKISNITYHENTSSGSRVSTMRTDRHDETNSGCSPFCERT